MRYSRRTPHGRQFPPQISKEDLLKMTRSTLTEKGVDNVSEAKYINEISTEVVGFDDAIFFSLQPEIKFRKSDAWLRSYAIVRSFLQENGMEQTLRSIEIELQGHKYPQTKIDMKGNEYLKSLMKVSSSLRRKAFSAKVAEFTGKYKNRRPINQSKRAPPKIEDSSESDSDSDPQPVRTTKEPQRRQAQSTEIKPTSRRESPSRSTTKKASPVQEKKVSPKQQEVQKKVPPPKPVQKQSPPAQKSSWKPEQVEEPRRQQKSSWDAEPMDFEEEKSMPKIIQKQEPPKKKDPFGPLPTLESKGQENSFEDISFGDEEDDFAIPDNESDNSNKKEESPAEVFSDVESIDDEVEEVAQQSPPQKQQPKSSGWDAQPMSDSGSIADDIPSVGSAQNEEEDVEFDDSDFDFD